MESTLSRPGFNPKDPDAKLSLFKKLLSRYRSSVETEHEQATLRLFLTISGVLYLWLIDHFGVLGDALEREAVADIWKQWWWPSMYFFYAIAHIVTLVAHPARLFLRRSIMLFLDNIVITILVSHGGLFNPFIALYFWIAIGYGFRYGPSWLVYSCSNSVVCFLFLLYFVPIWTAGSIFGYSMILSLCVASGHAFHLLRRLKQVQSNLVLKATELETLATRDYLTGLVNRALLIDRLKHAITFSARTGNDVAMLFIDVDGLKRVNDLIGHAAGDALLIEVSKRLLARLRATDTCARIAGDEFVIVLEGASDRDSVLRLAGIMLNEVRSLTSIVGQPIEISASIGVAWLSDIVEPMRSPDSFLAVADHAMYEAKHSGKNRYCIARPRPA